MNSVNNYGSSIYVSIAIAHKYSSRADNTNGYLFQHTSVN
jgi:hypothetical protein